MKKLLLGLILLFTGSLSTLYAQSGCAGVHYTPIAEYPIGFGTHYGFGNSGFIIGHGDFDNDGKEDLAFIAGVSVYTPPYQLLLQRNIRTGSLPSQVTFDTSINVFKCSSSVSYMDFVVNDFNNDGKDDIAIVYGNSTGLDSPEILINKGTSGTFSFYYLPTIALSTAEIYSSAFSLKTGDFDHDGKKDLMYVGTDNLIYVLRCTSYTSSSATFAATSSSTGVTPAYNKIYAQGDMNNDNLPEIAYPLDGTDTIVIYQNASTPGTIKYNLAQKVIVPGSMSFTTFWDGYLIQIKDLNGDQKADIIVLANMKSSQYLLFLKNTSTLTKVSATFNDSLELHQFVKTPYNYKEDNDTVKMNGDPYIDFSDFSLINNDPCHIKPDILLSVEGASQKYSVISYLANTSTLSKISYSAPCWFEHFTSDRAGVGDFNGDGKDDLLSMCDVCVPGTPNYGLSILENISTVPTGSNKIFIDTVKLPCSSVTINGNIKSKIYLPCKVYKHYGTDSVTIKWTPNVSSSDTATLKYNKPYSVHVYNQSHSYDTTIHIIFHDPNGTAINVAFGDTTICLGRSIKLEVNNYNKSYTYHWWPNTAIDNDSTPYPNVNPTVTTTYSVTATGGKCVIDTSVIVRVHNPPVIVTYPVDTIICKGRPVQLSAFGCTSYVWSPSKPLDFDSIQTPTARVDSTTTFKVEGYDGYCYALASAIITVLPAPKVHAGKHWTIHTNEAYTINDASVTGDYFDYWWKPNVFMNDSTLLHPTVSPPYSIWYYLYSTNAYGCIAVDSVFIKFDPTGHIFVPTSFTPNRDGVNDQLSVKKENVRTFHMQIFNRWGQLVFETDNLYKDWDGRYKGENAPIGSYVYFVQATDIGGHPINQQGNITLLR